VQDRCNGADAPAAPSYNGGMQKVLVVDDDPGIREVVCFALQKAGFATVIAADGEQALARFAAEKPALVVLDILMPELDGVEVCRRLRAALEVDRLVGLEVGGDDYIAKPFSPRELVARVRAILRRSTAAPAEKPEPRLVHGRLALDPEQYKAFWDGHEMVLTLTEFGILRSLLRRPGRVCTRDILMNEAYELHKIVSDRTIDSHVRRVRAKFAALGADPVETVHGVGYKLGRCA
jgi:two-component system, OmpR family, response regulator